MRVVSSWVAKSRPEGDDAVRDRDESEARPVDAGNLRHDATGALGEVAWLGFPARLRAVTTARQQPLPSESSHGSSGQSLQSSHEEFRVYSSLTRQTDQESPISRSWRATEFARKIWPIEVRVSSTPCFQVHTRFGSHAHACVRLYSAMS
eukprot:scaffold37820_cov62-Phaeocystis_antarctica.AAC.1